MIKMLVKWLIMSGSFMYTIQSLMKLVTLITTFSI
jgi:hypothetical protein